MFATCKLVFVYVVLGIPAGVIGIPYSLLAGNVNLLYRLVIHRIVPWGARQRESAWRSQAVSACRRA